MVGFDPSEATKRAISALTPSGFEQLAYVVVRAEFPGVRRLRAPDGGADLVYDGPPKRVWQAKRYSEIDWSNCRESLRRAASFHKPKRVTFVFPNDLTARQDAAFQILRDEAPLGVKVDVVTFSWFDAELSRPELAGVRDRLLSPRSHSLVGRLVTLAHPPVIPYYWTPRNDLLLSLDEWWQKGTENILALIGIGGTGKSTLVQRWLEDLKGATETGELEGLVQFSLYEHGSRSFRDFLELANRALGVPLAAGDEVDLLLDLLAEHRVLVVLDGAERLLREYATAAPELVEERDPSEVTPSAREIVDQAAWRFIVGLASRQLTGRFVLTSRLMPHDLEDAERCLRLDLGGLRGAQAVTLLRTLGIEGDDAELERAADTFDGHPFSLARLANVLRVDPVAPGDVRRAPRYQEKLDLRRRQRDIFDRAFDVLPTNLREILFLLAAARGAVLGADLETLSDGARVPAGGDTVRELINEMWLDRDVEGSIRLHSVARRWLASRDPNARRRHQLHADLWYARATSLDLAAIAKRKAASVADLQPVTELVYHLARAGKYDDAWLLLDGELSATLAGRFAAHSIRSELLLEFFVDRIETGEYLLSNTQSQGSLLNSLANDLTLLGQPARAIGPLERAVQLGGGDNPNSLAVRLGNLALTRIRIGQLRQADDELNEQRVIGLKHDDLTNVLVALQEHARLKAICGKYDIAWELLGKADSLQDELEEAGDEALQRFSPIGWQSDRKRHYISFNRRALGVAYRALLKLLSGLDARTEAQEAVLAAELTGDERPVTRARGLLGASLAAVGEGGAARELLSGLLREVRIVGIADMEPDLLTATARSWLSDNPTRSYELAKQAERVARRNGNRLQLADSFLVLAWASNGDERRRWAEQARRAAWCDGPPFVYESVASEAEEMM